MIIDEMKKNIIVLLFHVNIWNILKHLRKQYLDLLVARIVSSCCFYLLERDVDVIRHDGFFELFDIVCIHMWAINSKGVKFTKQFYCISSLLFLFSHNNKHLETFNFEWFSYDDFVIVYCIRSSYIKLLHLGYCIIVR